jgi:hypothetical protein
MVHDWTTDVEICPACDKAAIDGIFCDGLRGSHAKGYDQLAKAKRNAAKDDKDTQQSSRDIDNALSDRSWGGIA